MALQGTPLIEALCFALDSDERLRPFWLALMAGHIFPLFQGVTPGEKAPELGPSSRIERLLFCRVSSDCFLPVSEALIFAQASGEWFFPNSGCLSPNRPLAPSPPGVSFTKSQPSNLKTEM